MDNNVLSASDILREYGGVDKNMLKNLLDAYEHDANELDIIQNSLYYSINNLPKTIRTDDGNFTILCLNTDGLLSKIEELRVLVAIFGYQGIYVDVICIQESHLDDTYDSKSALIQINGYDCIPQGKHCGNKGGLVTYVRDRHDSEKLQLATEKSDIWEGLYVEVKTTEGFRIIVSNIYKPPRRYIDIDRFTKESRPILDKIKKESCDAVFAGDFNINLLQLNEKLKYQEFFDQMTSYSFYPKITLPTRIGKRSSTLIDNIFCRLTQNTTMSNSGIVYSSISDHFPYFMSFKPKVTKKKEKQAPKFVKKKMSSPEAIEKLKQDLLKHDFSKDLPSLLGTNDIDPNKNYDIFIEKVLHYKNIHLPEKLVKFNKHRHKQEKWITEGIIKSIKYRDNLHLQVTRSDPDSPEYPMLVTNLKTFNGILKKSIRDAKCLYYYEIFNKYKNDMKNMWANINSLITKSCKGKEIKEIIVNGIKIQDKQQIVNEFNKFYVNVGPDLAATIDTHNKKPFTDYLTKNITSSFSFHLYELEDTEKIIKSLKTKDSFGNDGISVKLLKAIAPGIILPITLILNQSLITGIFPDTLKIAKVIPLYKKDDRCVVGNYRPVSLLNALSKVFERAAYNQLSDYFKDNNLFYEHQYGFREQHSTEQASLELIDRVLFDLDKKKNPVVIYMDLSKAFDTLDHKILLHKLKYYGIDGTALKWFSSYLSNRFQYVKIESLTSEMAPITTGVPQGSILGPLLFLIYMNDIPSASDIFKFILFADDTSLKSFINSKLPGFSIESSTRIFNIELQKVNDWLAVNKLSLNVKKTKFMLFHTTQKKNIANIIPKLKIGNVLIERKENFNFLGLIINETLSWKPHVNSVANRISKYVGVLNRLKRYLPCAILKTIYVSLVQSKMNYALLAWGYNCGRLKKLQKKAIRIITNSKYLQHTTPLLKKLNLLKLEDMFKLNMLKWYFRYQNGQLPRYFLDFEIKAQKDVHNINTRHKSHIAPPVPRMQCVRKCLRNTISTVINLTPKNVVEKIDTHSFAGFSDYAKKQMLMSYSEVCLKEDCYSCESY